MPVTVSYPGIYIEELPSSARTITAAPTSITAFVGYTHPFAGEVAETKPPQTSQWGKARRIFSFAEYERVFGGLYPGTELPADVANAVYQFFLNGGSDAYVVGLQPKFDVAGVATAFQPATAIVGGTTFTAKQVTDGDHKLRVAVRNVRSAGSIADFTITHGHRVETFPDVTPTTLVTRMKSSQLVSVTASPAVFTAEVRDLIAMSGGAPLFNPQDFISVLTPESDLDKVDIFNLLVTPGVTESSVVSAALAFCQANRAFYIIDAPQTSTADGMGTGLPKIEDDIGSIPPSPNGAIYFPWLKRIDSLTGKAVPTPPSGYVAGIYARTDVRRGVWKAPAGLETTLLNTTGVVAEGVMSDMRQGILNKLGVNVLRSFPGSGTVVWGARTMMNEQDTSLQQWRYVPVRRMALFIEQTLARNLGWVVFEPNDEPLWTAIRISIENFMLSLFRQAAFEGSTPSEAFLVQCDETTTTDTDIANGIVNIVVGFRPLKPAEFVIIKIAQLAGQVQA